VELKNKPTALIIDQLSKHDAANNQDTQFNQADCLCSSKWQRFGELRKIYRSSLITAK
jgi:hypothetical protein